MLKKIIKKKEILYLIFILLIGLIFIFFLNFNFKKKNFLSTKEFEKTTNSSIIETKPTLPNIPQKVKTPLGEFDLNAPQKTNPLPEEKVKEVLKKEDVYEIVLSKTGIYPKEFTVKRNKVISLVVKAVDGIFVLQFKEPLNHIRVGLSANETRGISFLTPDKPGDYIYYREVPGYENDPNPLFGIMHVK
jgi:hypothetical protein